MKGLGGVLLGGFLWLGVPRCSAVYFLSEQARCFVEATPVMLTASEWRAVLRAWQTDAVLDRLAVRLR